MARYTGRSSPITSAAAPKFFSLGKSLAARRNARVTAASKPVVQKPSLTTSKQKEAEIQKTLDKSYMPSGLKLAKLRQLAAQHKILGQQARDFLHRSAGGVKQQGTEGLKKFETELLEAEQEVIAAQGGKNPMKFEYRQDADHPLRLAKKMVKGLYHEAAEQAAAAQRSTLLEQRQERLNIIHGILDRGQPAAAAPNSAAAPSVPSSTPAPTLQQPTPLPTASRPAFAPLSGGSRITENSGTPSLEPTPLGPPTVVHRAPDAIGQPNLEPVLPSSPPTETTAQPPVSPPSAPDVQLPDTSHLSDPFGGEE